MDDPHPYLVVPGQVIAVSSSNNNTNTEEDSFLRGHGTYLETIHNHNHDPDNANNNTNTNTNTNNSTIELRAAVTGIVQRINKLVSVESVSLHTYHAQVGDLIVGRVAGIANAKWLVDLSGGNGNTTNNTNNSIVTAQLPLSGVHLPGAVQRVKTAADALTMAHCIAVGDLVSCEVHKVMNHNNNIMLHTRSVRYGKLENGCVVTVPAKLIPRRKTHYTTLLNHRFQILLGCNGMIWLQRSNNTTTSNNSSNYAESGNNTSNSMVAVDTESAHAAQHQQPDELAEAEESRRVIHAATLYTRRDRLDLARVRNAILCLRQTLVEITPHSIEQVYYAAVAASLAPPSTDMELQAMEVDNTTGSTQSLVPQQGISIADMLLPENVVFLTSVCRQRRQEQ